MSTKLGSRKSMKEEGALDSSVFDVPASLLEQVLPDNSQDKFVKGEQVYLLPTDKLKNSPGNIFDPWDKQTMFNNKISILNNGLFSPIIVKDNNDGTYMILAGHNRTEAYRELSAEAKELGKLDIAEQFSSIPAFIKPSTITEEECIEIIVDTNIKARAKLSRESNLKVMAASIEIMKRQKTLSGKTFIEILKENDIKKTSAYEAVRILKRGTSSVLALYYKGKITKKILLALTGYDMLTQEYIVSNYGDKMTYAILENIPKQPSPEEIDEVFESFIGNDEDVLRTIKMTIKMSEVTLFDEWLKTWDSYKSR